MTMLQAGKLTRRSLIAGAATLLAAPQLSIARQATPAPVVTPRPDPVTLTDGLTILDIRITPYGEVPRVLIELCSELDQNVDTPGIGALLPGDVPIWLSPYESVTYAGESTLLIGNLPEGVEHDALINATWQLCVPGSPTTTQAELMKGWDLEIEVVPEVISDTHLGHKITATNQGTAMTWGVFALGTVWDADDRICGGTVHMNFTGIEPGDSRETGLGVTPALDNPASPFHMVQSVQGMHVDIRVQPTLLPVQHACPAIMPWNN